MSPYIVPGLMIGTQRDIDLIIDTVCDYTGISKEKILGVRQDAEIAIARHYAIYIIWDLFGTNMPFNKIGSFMNRNHSSVNGAVRKINGFIDINDFVTVRDINNIKNNINNKLCAA